MLVVKIVVACTVWLCFFAAILFFSPRALHWWRAWVLLGLIVVYFVLVFPKLYRTNKELLVERMKGAIQKGQPLADRLVLIPFVLSYLALLVLIPIDVFHLHWLPKPELLLSSLGQAMFVSGMWLVVVAMLQNSFATSVVRYQEERGQKLVDSGVYAKVRHPMYSGAVLFMIGMPLWLESSAAAVFALVPIAMLMLRIGIEERFLVQHLEGYAEYRDRVRYRIIPGIW